MAGRPPLRIGSHGKITRKYLGGGVWLARCRFRDSDGVTRIVERRGPADDMDQHGKLAEDLLVEALASRRSPASGEVSLDTLVMALVGAHIDQLTEDGRLPRPSTRTATWRANWRSSLATSGWERHRRPG